VWPLKEGPDQEYTGYERRIYDDQVTLKIPGDISVVGMPHSYFRHTPAGSLTSHIHPNPFRESIRIGYELPEPCRISLEVYDLSGNQLVQLEREHESSGFFEFTWDGRDRSGREVAPGVYFGRLITTTERHGTIKLVRF
jgi:hypothetical protein